MKTAYANSWLLTEVLSDDYVDRTGDGPTDDDYGYWVKFTYQKVADNYQWRVPYQDADYNAGLKNDPNTFTGVMTYGEKELYYIKAIETKTHIAVFSTSPRYDGLGANNMIPGGQGPNSGVMNKLDKISLYTKSEYGSLTSPNVGAIPIKEVHFGYKYDLCSGAPNSNSPASSSSNNSIVNAKLTLEQLYFTYQNSTRGQFSPYTFQYDLTSTGNPLYKDSYVDRWGNFKDNSRYGSNYPYYDFPYTDQYYINKQIQANIAANPNLPPERGLPTDSWQMTGIGLPTGGQIRVNYELKDYAYEENQPALAMFDIGGFDVGGPQASNLSDIVADRQSAATAWPVLMEDPIPSGTYQGDYQVWFRLETPAPAGWTGADIYQHYLDNGNIHNVYYKVYNDMLGHGQALPAGSNAQSDYVSGYADVVQDPGACGVSLDGNFGYITLQPVPICKLNIFGLNLSPMTRAAVEHLRADRSELLYATVPYSNSPLAQILNFIGSIPAVILQILQSLTGFNFFATQIESYGEYSYLNGRSVIRLAEPSSHKFGGGSRVQQLTLSDNWTNGNPDNYDYGQTYSYNLPD
ncbi:MAG TPA: hypothetical protein VNZ45_00625, partial [Bacteroidia bacterium]|nr:hypothetical protein [Bacteroidia bacterium]